MPKKTQDDHKSNQEVENMQNNESNRFNFTFYMLDILSLTAVFSFSKLNHNIREHLALWPVTNNEINIQRQQKWNFTKVSAFQISNNNNECLQLFDQ